MIIECEVQAKCSEDAAYVAECTILRAKGRKSARALRVQPLDGRPIESRWRVVVQTPVVHGGA